MRKPAPGISQAKGQSSPPPGHTDRCIPGEPAFPLDKITPPGGFVLFCFPRPAPGFNFEGGIVMSFANILEMIDGWVWGPVMLVILEIGRAHV